MLSLLVTTQTYSHPSHLRLRVEKSMVGVVDEGVI
jgi:hypothetical protein